MKRAVEEMVFNGKSRSEAAALAELRDDSLYRALLRPGVLGFRNRLLEVIRTSEASRTFARVSKLADEAVSEHVRLNAATWLGEVGGISPVQHSETTHNFGRLGPGLVIVVAPPREAQGSQAVEGGAREIVHATDSPGRVPHPAEKGNGFLFLKPVPPPAIVASTREGAGGK